MFTCFARPFVDRSSRRSVESKVQSWLIGAGVCLFQVLLLCPFSQAEIPLPTPRWHYEKFRPGTSRHALLSVFVHELDPAIQQMLLNFAQAAGLPVTPSIFQLDPATQKTLLNFIKAAGLPRTPPIPKAQTLALVKKVNWAPWRPQLLEFFVHQSRVLDMIPEKWGTIWIPMVHDASLYFLAHLPEDRLLDS